ncbi:type II toxin-antitoxin system RelE/ParE family toxin [Haliea sp.]
MTRIELAPQVGEDLERIFAHLVEHEAADTAARITAINRAITVLEDNPLLGRPTGDDLRELVIGRRSQGYIALYRYVSAIDVVFVLAVRSQREAGYLAP